MHREVAEAFERRKQVETELMKRLGSQMARDGRSCSSHELMQQVLQRYGDQLPPWPPPVDSASRPAATAAPTPGAAAAAATRPEGLDDAVFETAMAAKQRGNVAFGDGRYSEAMAAYDDAVACYGASSGSASQREEKVKVLSNRAECSLKLERWAEAELSASDALDLDSGHAKSLLRRGKARMQLGGESLVSAEMDLRAVVAARGEGATAAAGLLKTLAEQRRSERQAAAKGFRTGFAAALGGGAAGSATSTPPEPSALPALAAWANGLNESQRMEWLIDCYRLRWDDDYAHGGGDTHGLYSGEGEITKYFLIFCRLAEERKVVPPRWDWTAFLQQAGQHLRYAFEKSDAQKKWGGENIFSAATGGRSLRYTAEVIYGSSCQYGSKPNPRAKQLEDLVHDASDLNAKLCMRVGGLAAWRTLLEVLGESWDGYDDGYSSGEGEADDFEEEDDEDDEEEYGEEDDGQYGEEDDEDEDGDVGGGEATRERVLRVATASTPMMLKNAKGPWPDVTAAVTGQSVDAGTSRPDMRHRAEKLQHAISAEAAGGPSLTLLCGDAGDLANADSFTRQLAQMKPPCVADGRWTLFDLFQGSASDRKAGVRFAEYPVSGFCPKCQVRFMEGGGS